ncbi:MAG: translocation/assembly module TamB domain-containing protein [Burkholderiales bacterium]|nr:translocation/assembly module TamB domain-containing protein [Burkholderiales bacterium]
MARRALKISLAVVVLLVVLAGVCAALLVRAPVAASLAERFTKGLTIEGAEGSLLSGISIQRIRYEDRKLRVDIESLRAEANDIDILPARIDLATLRMRKVTVTELAKSDGPAAPPASLAVPMPIAVRAASIAELVWQPLGAKPVTVRDIEARFAADAQSLRIDSLAIEYDGMRARLSGSIDAAQPFALNAEASATGKTDGHAWQADLKAGGNLLAMDAAASMRTTGNGPAALINAKARLEPFKPQPVAQAEISVTDLNLRAWEPAAPQTKLSGSVLLQPDAQGFAGTVRIANTLTGTLDKALLPVQSLNASLQLDRQGNARLANIRVDAGRAGQLAGAGQWAAPGKTLALDLDLALVDLRAWHTALVRTSLQGPVALNLTPRDQTAKLAVKDAELALNGEVKLTTDTASGQVTLAGTKVGQAEGRFEVGLKATRAFTAAGTLSRVNLAALGKFPQSQLNGRFDVSGVGNESLTLKLDLADSTLTGRPFNAKADVRLRGKVLERGNLTAQLAGNHLAAQGAFGTPGATLQWQVRAPNLATLGSAFEGEVRGGGTLTGTLEQPELQATLNASGIKLPGNTTIADVDLNARIAQAREAPLNVTANIRKLRMDHRELIDQLGIKVDGTGAAHTASLTARNDKWTLDAATRGGFGDYWSWAGELVTFNARGPLSARLQKPARLLVGGERQRIDNAVFDVGGGELIIEALDRTPTTIDSRGTLSRFPVTALYPLLDPAVTDLFTSTLRLKGGWDVNWVDLPNVRANIEREDGDLTLKSTPPFAFGLSQLGLAVNSSQRTVRMDFNGIGSAAGKIALDLTFPITLRDGNLEVDRTAALSGNADIQLPSLRWVGPWLGPAHDVDGLLTANLKLGGAWPHVRPAGRIAGANIRYAHLTEGISFRDGELAASIANHVITLDQFTLRGGEGVFDAVGRLELDESDPTGGIDWRADKLHLLNLVDRSVVASGAGNIALKNRQLFLTGQLRADSGRIILTETSSPTLSEDVVVLGRNNGKKAGNGERPLNLDLGLNLGNDFQLTGRGLDVRLGGRLQVTSAPGNPLRTTGTLRSRAGTYKAYGQELAIERAVVSFNGRIDNPSLDILAERRGMAVEVGVNISGTAEKPVLKLVSTPDMPDGEKLSWLVLGRGSDGMDQSDRGAMQAAARTLLAQGAAASLAGSLASTLGVDEISLGSSASASATPGTESAMVVTVGKRLSSRASILYEQGLNGADSLIKLSYQLSRRWRVQLVTGSENAVDFFYRLAFD